MKELWQRILRWFETHVPPGFFAPQPGATEAELEAAESSLGVRLPEDFRESYRLHNGGRNGAFFRNYELMPLDQLLRRAAVEKEAATMDLKAVLGIDLVEYVPRPKGPIKTVFWNVRWIPFMDTGAADFFCLDLDPAPGGVLGQIIEYGHDFGPERLIASSFREWFSQFADDLEAGEYRFNTRSYNIERIHETYPPEEENPGLW
jgi:cell wall assembly regulator SMI1